ncbi:hypothetical protein KPL70_017294 [Citrus sinensis]|nr:hypothetical protein KPL70_017294 [Citrus sinensis]
MLAQRYYGPEFDQKEREIKRLKAELAQIESEKQRPTLFTTSPPIPSIGPTYHPFASMLSPIRQYDPSKLFCMTHTLFRDNPLPQPLKPKPKPKPQPRLITFHPSSITIPGQHSPGHTPASPPVPPPPTESQPPSQSKDKQPMHQFSAHTVDHSSTTDDQTSDSNLAVSDSHTETDIESSVSTKVEEEMPESSATNQPPPAQAYTSSPSQKSSNGPWFTFDDLPSHKWRDRLNEMSAWIDLQMLRPGATTQSVLREFATRFTGALRDWFDSLGCYRQLQFVDLPKLSSALAVLHDQFLGEPSAVFEAARRDYLNMKCCSLNAKDLDFHYKRMSLLFYKLNGFNEPTLKHLAKTCLDKLCEQKQFFKELLKDKEPFRSAYKKPYLQIKCKKKKDCDCSPKKKRHFKKFRNPEFSSKPRRSRKPYRFFRKKSSSSRDFKQRKSSRCFICKKKGHYAKDCPNKREKSIRVRTAELLDDSDSDQSQVIFQQQLLSLDTTIPIPSIKLQILPLKFQRPIPAIGLIDTGAQCSMLNPHILPPEYWTEYEEHFKAVNGKLFTTSLITEKPIGIKIFPNCVIWTKVIGSTLPNKDLLLGFDILHQIKHLQILPNGIRVKFMFKPFIDILKLYNLSETPQPYQDISNKLLSFCPESHSEFTHPNPLWKNKSFFIKLPFKLNEDINPTKATHPGMSPSDLLLAQQECSQLLAQGSHDEYRQLLTQFYDIVQSHGIMLSAKKSTITTDNIEFLDASDDSWGAILLEEINGKEHFIAYASGQFSDTQKHYHSVFKEILAVKNGIKKFEYHLIGHHFLIRMDSSAFPNILNFKEKPLTLFSTTYHFPIISMATSLPPEALTKTTFPFNKNFSSVFAIQEFAKKALFRFFMKAYLVTEPFPFSSFHPKNLFLTGLTLDPSRETTEDVLWYIWCLTVLYATKLVLPITPTLEHLLDLDKATSLTWTLLEWFSPIPWWRKKLQQLSEIYNLERMPAPEAQLFTSVFIIHRPYFQHPDTKLFWIQDQAYEWFTAPHLAVIENEIQDILHNYLCQLNHQPPPLKDIFHTSLGPQYDLLMIPTPSAISKPKSTGIIIKEEKPDYTDFLFQDSQDPWEDFLPLSQHLQQFPQPSMNEPGSSSQPPKADTATKPSKVDKATQTSPRPGYRRDCPYPPCRGPYCKHPKLSKTFFPKSNRDTDLDETESSSEDDYMNLRTP